MWFFVHRSYTLCFPCVSSIGNIFHVFNIEELHKSCNIHGSFLSHCALVMQYNDIDLGQHWLRYWLVGWWHQAITWNNVGFPSLRCCIHLRAISQWVAMLLFCVMILKVICFQLLPHSPESNELNNTELQIALVVLRPEYSRDPFY